MKSMLLFVVSLALITTMARADMGVVKTDHVNLRAQAKANAEVITQLARGDRLTILDKKTVPYGQRSMTWLKVALPDKATVWIKSEFVKNGVVAVDKVNVRSGAGINFSIVGLAHRGDKVETVRTLGEWLEIRPLPGSFGWISADYVELTPDLQAPPASDKIQAGKTPTAPVAAGVNAPPAKATASTNAPPVAPGVIALETPPSTSSAVVIRSGVPVTREGTVYSSAGMLIKRPGTHSLWLEGVPDRHLIAYLNSPNISLEPFEGKKVQVIGTETMLANWNNPVIEVQQIQPMW
jgi:uncharacterized protein YgiM (DUF1202 family)